MPIAETRQQSESAQAQAEGAQTRNDETIATPGNREAEKNNHARSYTPAIVAAGIVLVAVIAAFSVLVARKRSGSDSNRGEDAEHEEQADRTAGGGMHADYRMLRPNRGNLPAIIRVFFEYREWRRR